MNAINNKLIELVKENPNLELKIMVSADPNDFEEYSSLAFEARYVQIEELALHDNAWLDYDDLYDRIFDDLMNKPDYKYLSDDDYEKAVELFIKNTYKFKKYICIYV